MAWIPIFQNGCNSAEVMETEHFNSNDITVIVPNFKRRITGVTVTIIQLVKAQKNLVNIATVGFGLPDSVRRISILKLLFISNSQMRVWHARRNMDLVMGLILRDIIGKKLNIVFTCSNPRPRTPSTNWMIKKIDALVGTSEKMQINMPRPLDRIIPHGVDCQKFQPTDNKLNIRQKLDLPEGILIGCFGRIRPMKGTDIFVNSMLGVMQNNPTVVALVIGRATNRHSQFFQELQDRVADRKFLDRFIFKPEVSYETIHHWYQSLDLYVAPHRSEGYGMTALEAMACGIPIVATKAGAFELFVEPDKTGKIVDCDDIESISAAIEGSISSPIVANANDRDIHESVKRRLSIEREAESLVELYQELITH